MPTVNKYNFWMNDTVILDVDVDDTDADADDDIESDGTNKRERIIVVIRCGPIYYSSSSLISIIYCTNFPSINQSCL